ncbi:hypothetical protein ACEPAI_3874 [Sanghuangporus weigelae]
MSVAPQSSSSAAANDAPPPPASQARSRPEKVLAKGPFWARLPALRTMTSTIGGSQSQAQESGSPVPPIALPDRVSSTRILLSDTQACIQKLSARMDIIGSRSEQALKEIQLAREALETGSEKTVAEIADVVYRCQATLIKSIEVQESILDKINGSIAKLTISSDALLKLYEAHNASLASLTQTMHGIMNVQQSAQVQHTQLVGTIIPLEPLVRSIPVHIDALVPAVERIIERSLERALSRLPIGAYMREQIAQGPHTPRRGQKRQRSSECEIPPIDTNRIRRRSTIIPADLQTVRDPSSPLLDRQRSGIGSTERLRTRGSLRRSSAEAACAGTLMEGREETPVPHGSFSRRTSRRPTLPMPNVSSSISGPANKRPRTESAIRTAIASRDDVDALQASLDISCNTETAQPTAVGAVTIVPTFASASRTTRIIAKAKMVEDMITTSRVPFGSPPGSVNNGLVNADEIVAQTPLEQAAGSENVQPVLADKKNDGPSKTKSKTPKKKGAVPKKGKGRPKKATIAAAPASGTILHPDSKKSILSKSKSTSKDTSPKRATTGNSDASLVSAASVHGPPNSPSTHTKSSPIPFVESNNASSSPALAQVTIRDPGATATNVAMFPKARTLISLIDVSQESSVLVGQGNDGAGLTAALAHVDNDINFTSGLGVGSMRQEIVNTDTVDLIPAEDTGNAVNMFSGFRKTEKIPSEPGSTLFKGRTKRFLVIDNDSTENDILDELFAE